MVLTGGSFNYDFIAIQKNRSFSYTSRSLPKADFSSVSLEIP
jgi:hypothetical protein